MSGFGIAPYGTSPYGSLAGDLYVVNAFAVTTHSVRVTFSTAPLAASSSGLGDALNAATWVVTNPTTTFTVTAISSVNAITFDVFLLEPLASVLVTHTVAVPTMVKASGVPIVAPTSATFLGLLAVAVSTPAADAANRGLNLSDVANPPTQIQDQLGGTLVMTSGGDYAFESGAPLLRKLIIRRLTTMRGEFFHLPNYGLGLAVKEPLPVGDTIKLRAEIERQIRLEPEVSGVSANVIFSPGNGILSVLISATVRQTGERVDIPFQFPTGTVRL